LKIEDEHVDKSVGRECATRCIVDAAMRGPALDEKPQLAEAFVNVAVSSKKNRVANALKMSAKKLDHTKLLLTTRSQLMSELESALRKCFHEGRLPSVRAKSCKTGTRARETNNFTWTLWPSTY
jgi:hypothetical protein